MTEPTDDPPTDGPSAGGLPADGASDDLVDLLAARLAERTALVPGPDDDCGLDSDCPPDQICLEGHCT